MPIPVSNRVVFTHNVLAGVLCQLRFPPILLIAAGEPVRYQEQVRARYPLYRKDEGLEIPPEIKDVVQRFGIGGALPESLRHAFSTANSARSIYLTRDFLAIEETAYKRWEEFRPEVIVATEALRDVYTPPFFTRIGLRYQDVIDKTKIPSLASVPWHELIKSPLAGFLGVSDLAPDVIATNSQSIFRLESVPNAKVQVQHGLRNLKDGVQVFYFDSDFFLEAQTEIGNVIRTLDTFHEASGNLFRWAIEDRLSRALGPKPL